MKQVFTVTFIIIDVLFLLLWVTSPKTEEVTQGNMPNVSNNNDDESSLFKDDPIDLEGRKRLIIRDPSAPVTLVEYGNFKCSSCNAFHHSADARIRDEFVQSRQVNIEFRNYPFIGPDSKRAARGA